MSQRDRSAIVLAGGSGKRLHGLEKCLLEVSGVPMIELVLGAVKEVCDEIIVSLSSPLQRIKIGPLLDNIAVVYDTIENFGPLEGIRQACRVVSHRFTVVVACDMPLLNPSVIDYLFSKISRYDGAIPIWPDGKVEPLCSVFESGTLEKSVKRAVMTDNRRIMDAIKWLNIRYVQTCELEEIDPGLYTFYNVNDEKSLERVRSVMADRKGI
ncbi:MAG: molybdenum cofactor guanylyltransferase [Thermoproteota archaeon]